MKGDYPNRVKTKGEIRSRGAAFYHEVEQEKREAAHLDAFRRTTARMLAGVKLEGSA